MSARDDLPAQIKDALRWPLALTRLGMGAEAIVRSFWPLWSLVFAVLAFLMLGLHDILRLEVVWAILAAFALGLIWSLVWGIRRFHWPSRPTALARLDATMPGNPILATMDNQAIGADDDASLAVWAAHQARMQARLKDAKAVEPDLRVSQADPYALRYVATLALLVALVFGSVLRVQSVSAMGPTVSGLASGPTWEGWLEPPSYTGLPSIYLNDITAPQLDAPEGSRVTLRFYGEVGALGVRETVSNTLALAEPTDAAVTQTAQEFSVAQSGTLEIEGAGGRSWDIAVIPDQAPEVLRSDEIEASYEGEAQIPFTARDDYGVVEGSARFQLALDSVDRRYGLRIAPETRAPINVPLPMPITGDRADFSETLIDNFSEHPWANMPVTLNMSVTDDAGQTGDLEPEVITLPGRRFFDPMAAAIIEQRRALLWNRDNATDISMLLRAVSYNPDSAFRSATDYLRLRAILRRVEALSRVDMTDDQQAEIAEAMWDLALRLEEGDLQDALERLERAQDRLAEAMRNGASDEEIAELMQEMRDATDDYLRQLSRQAQQDNPDQQSAQNDQNMVEMNQSDLQAMMDRIQELMEQGRMAEAQEALEQLRQMMENMQVTQGQGQQGQSPGEQAMEGLGETLREQQGLSDQAFRDLQEQFNPGQDGQQQPGKQGQQPGQQGQGQQGQPGQQGQGQQPGQGDQGQNGEGQSLEESLADRQNALRQELNRQSRSLPGAGTEAGDAARDALERAEGAMEGAEQALRENDLAGAIDNQSEAMEALREGMRNLGDAIAQQQQGQSQQGLAEGADPGRQRDPLGRSVGSDGQIGSDENLLQGEDVYRRARELLDEIRRRSGEGERPAEELEYLERLLDRF